MLILRKDNQSKYKMQFLNDYFIYSVSQTSLAVCEKVIAH